MKRFLSVIFFVVFALTNKAWGILAPEELQNALFDKSKQLQEINNKIQETQKTLLETTEKSQSLQQELKKASSNIYQLGLNINLSEVTIDKLSLEIESLQYDIDKTQQKIDLKKSAINKILREIQSQDDEDPLIVFLKNKTLAEGIAENKSLSDVKNQLYGEEKELRELKSNLDEKLEIASKKKSSKEKEQQNLKVRKTLVEDEKKERQKLLSDTKNQEKVYQQIISDLAKKQVQIAEEIEQFEAELRSKIDPNALPARRAGVLSWPIIGRKMTQNYGATSFARYGYKGKWHNGIDIGAPIGTTVVAPDDGIVLNTGNQDQFCRKGAYGKYIVIRHSNNLVSLFAHLSQMSVSPGSQIKRGDAIGYVGNTGYSTGSHLHFTVYDGNSFSMRSSRTCGPMPSGGDINPLNYLDSQGLALYIESIGQSGGLFESENEHHHNHNE
ncbi:MAG: peptidoglycan DD-metalloendopeptidase family protein [Patescibacteria group bacterium]